MALRVLMMGTGEFALPTFQTLIDSSHDVVGLVTQPDRVGQGHHQHVNPLKELAIAGGIPVFQPDNVNSPESLARLREFQAEIDVVAAYGQILTAELLGIPPRGAVNLHASLLPKYRGAAPIQYAIWKGEQETGVTLFQIEPKLDAGPMLGIVRTDIGQKETSGQLHDRLAQLAAPLTVQVLDDMERGTLQPIVQQTEGVTKAPRLKKEQGLIDWTQTPAAISCQIRAMQPWPMPYTFLHVPDRKPQRMLVLDVDPATDAPQGWLSSSTPGQINVEGTSLLVRTGDGAVQVQTLQPAGKRAMSAAEFLRGASLAHAAFGSEAVV
ncbi:methionyl-tRNA formyltransferase [Planctomicrobium piriforme]|uniref:Methionyl-tRNA formyltransferase n=1 Tax=Planctomicrobium piriforme TaxID=1576369 RepID=A0A1I3RM10_9PLAN|nr:methionyl-tRNA formyltransferase [Planctomicrobium piriforme]SFJ46287.1 methionyl-tRNA formyltransferase [Planctomicrobium piriforme]